MTEQEALTRIEVLQYKKAGVSAEISQLRKRLGNLMAERVKISLCQDELMMIAEEWRQIRQS